MDKIILRQQMLAKRRALTKQQVTHASEYIVRHLSSLELLQRSQVCMAFLAMADEPQLDPFMEWMMIHGKTVCVPRLCVEVGVMEAAAITNLSSVTTGKLGLRIPDNRCIRVEPDHIDVILVPGVAFDQTGARLGMGAGYYDRYLKRASRALFIGIAWDFQIVSKIPVQQHDIPVQYLITESGVYDCIQGKI